jgi:hypothetical protein
MFKFDPSNQGQVNDFLRAGEGKNVLLTVEHDFSIPTRKARPKCLAMGMDREPGYYSMKDGTVMPMQLFRCNEGAEHEFVLMVLGAYVRASISYCRESSGRVSALEDRAIVGGPCFMRGPDFIGFNPRLGDFLYVYEQRDPDDARAGGSDPRTYNHALWARLEDEMLRVTVWRMEQVDKTLPAPPTEPAAPSPGAAFLFAGASVPFGS